MSKIVIALGGNALGNTAADQLQKSQIAAKAIVDLIEAGNQVIISHGNGPQVGYIRLAFEQGHKNGTTPFMPFPECTAMSQGYIGYHLQQSIDEELVVRGYDDVPVVAMLTQVVVDDKDPAFQNPSKPVGGYFDESTANELMQTTGEKYVDDSGRGWRKVVPSPKPIDIYEKITLKTLIDAGQIVIACGGGGIPVVYRGKRYEGVDAVIDKDFAASKMADLVDADIFLILTAVDKICINFNKPDQQDLNIISVSEAKKYASEGHFAPGSMLPKVQAACMFAEGRKGRKSIIGSLERASFALSGQSGTTIML
ncbi:MAG: carbamate kinase [Treponema sp.]|jgi:carbamate kinase|nr:carbamate kinase [Treponema sp.]